MITIEKILPVYKVEHNAILSRQGDITIGWQLHLPEIFTRSAQEYEAGHQALVKAIKVLSPYTTVHQQDVYMQALSSGNGELDRPYLDHRCYLYLTKKPAGRKAANSGYSGAEFGCSAVPRFYGKGRCL
jgi:hypothetical protein